MQEDFDQPEIPLFFGRFLVHRAYIGENDLNEALAVQAEINGCLPCAALEEGLVSLENFLRCRDYQRSHAVSFENALLNLNLLNQDKIEMLARKLSEQHVQIGELLVKRNKLTRDQLAQALAEAENFALV
jgi:hypothetical protein